jgi:HlyD family secretion protein
MTKLDPVTTPPLAAINRQLLIAAGLLIALVLTLGIMAASFGMAGAVIAQGQVAVQSSVKKIQHPTGGVVSEILVKDGTHVQAGDVLVSLDATAPGANVTIVSDAVSELAAKQARLEAERDSRDAPRFAPSGNDGAALRARSDEERLFKIHAAARSGEKAQLRERIAQLHEQIRSYEEGARAKKQQIALITTELAGVRQLYQQNLVPLARLNALERDAAQLNGDIAQLGAAAAEARGKISETELQAIQVDQTGRADAGNQLGEVQNQLAELRQKKVTAQQDFRRVQIRAPLSGVVDHLTVHTIGGVIAPGEAIMVIVPDQAGLHVEAKIKPTDVDHVHVGQAATMRFSAFDQRTTPEMNGKVSHVSAEAEVDEKSGASFYIVNIEIPAAAVAKAKLNLVPGMPVEAFIQTGQRSLLSFLTKPLMDQLMRAFREG